MSENGKAYYTETELEERWGVNENFINKYTRQLGCYVRNPRLFHRGVADQFFAIKSQLRQRRKRKEVG